MKSSNENFVLILDLENHLEERLASFSQSTQKWQMSVASTIKMARKVLKKHTSIAVIAVYFLPEKEEEILDFIRFIRVGLKNRTTRIVGFGQDLSSEFEERLLSNQLDTYREINSLDSKSFQGLINSELRTFNEFQENNKRREAEINLFTALAKFSRLELDLNACFKEFNNTIGIVSGSILSRVLLSNEDKNISPSQMIYLNTASDSLNKDDLEKFKSSTNENVHRTFREGKTQICLEKESIQHKELSAIFSTEVHASLVFPLKCYENVIAVVECFIPEDHLNNISVSFINLIEKSAEQLSVLLERQQAESDLKKQYDRLKSALEELKNTQQQLYHSEKMASVGQLAAGLAHEINNPISFVMSNFSPLDDYVKTMTDLLKLHDSFMAAIDQDDIQNKGKLKSSITSLKEGADLNFILDDVRSLVFESREGLNRVKDIVTNLKEFSRVDRGDLSFVDIHQGIESTLKILTNQLKYGIEIIKDYGDIPEVECNLGLLNQVFMNLLHNAIQVLKGEGSIWITTQREGDQVLMSFKDNGPGIPEENIAKLFDPFFTTKPAGEGTGLGLSISYNIIEKHSGTITVESTVGEFTEFKISLPLKQS